jgi:ubiquinone/menaquinone biosynthesis C-methylase UbiE
MADDPRDNNRDVWDEVAPAWERHRDFLWSTTKHVGEWLVDSVGAKAGDTILDLAGGPGDNGFLAAERVGPRGRVIETDLAPQMVEVARRRAEGLGLPNVETRVLDAEKMDLADDSVDGIISRWGFMLMEEPDAALEGCRRVLKDGGRLAFSVWGAAEKNPWVTVVGMTMIQMGHMPSGDPYGPGGIFSMAEHETVRRLVTDAGFSDVTVEEMAVDWTFPSFDEAWTYMSEVSGSLATKVNELPSEEVAKIRSALEQNVETFNTPAGLTLPGATVNVVAQ